MAELSPGSLFGGYRIEAIAGQGGMGVVYRATQLGLDRAVGLKVIAPAFAQDEEFRERFKRESRLAASIEHPNVIPVYEAGENDDVLFLAMRFVDGTDLGSLLKREGRLEPIRAARLVAQIGAALDAAHGAGLVHRDVKPANALVAAEDHVYLTDFGLTKRAASASALTKTGQLVGTVDYVAPEQVEGGAVDARTDVYSLGCVLFHLLTGRVAYDKPSEMAKLFAHVNDPPPRPSDFVPGLPPALDAVVARGMAKSPEDRYLSAGDLGRAALAAAEHRGLADPERSVARGEAAPAADRAAAEAPTAPGTPPGAAGTRPRRLKLWAATGGAVVVLGVVAALLTGGGNGNSPSSSSSSSSTGGPTVPVTRSSALGSARTFTDGVNGEDITKFEDLYQGNFSQTIDLKSCTGAGSPMDVNIALAEWQCIFDRVDSLQMKLSGQETDVSTGTVTARYALTDYDKPFASGTVRFHLIPGKDLPRMDKVVFSGGKGTFKPTPSTTAAAAIPLTRAGGLGIVGTWADYWTDENLSGLEEIFGAPGFKMTVKGPTCSGAKSPMNLDVALAEYDCDFQKLGLPEAKATGVVVSPTTKTARGNWTLTDKGKAVSSGTFKMHLVPQPNDAQPKIDSLELVQS